MPSPPIARRVLARVLWRVDEELDIASIRAYCAAHGDTPRPFATRLFGRAALAALSVVRRHVLAAAMWAGPYEARA